MKCVVAKYLRLSAEDEDRDGIEKRESDSIVNQRVLIDDFIHQMEEFRDCTILEIIDDGKSGTNFERPGIRKLIDLAKKGKIKCIIVKDFSRFGRNLIETGDYLEQIFPVWGIRFISVNDRYDSKYGMVLGGAAGGIEVAFRNLIAEMYSRDLSDKVRSAKVALNKSGKTTASYAFYGYKKDPEDKGHLIIDEEAANIVRRIYRLREEGMTSDMIAQTLNREGVPTPNGRKTQLGVKRNWKRKEEKEAWSVSSINSILADERYTGKHIYGKRRSASVGKGLWESVPKADWIVVDGAYPVIISPEQYQRVRDIAGTKQRCVSAAKRSSEAHQSRAMDEITQTLLQRQAAPAGAPEVKTTPDFAALQSEAGRMRRLAERTRFSKMSVWERYQSGDMTKETFQKRYAALSERVLVYEARAALSEAKARELICALADDFLVPALRRATGVSVEKTPEDLILSE